ncbi:MAG TPA: TIR domain-containing protein [Gammaproteobacteria bacterium]|nr:TIR domain-containing protein [Gammaproteobacteria bacterium]
MADVFVSYARSDKARVVPLVAALEAKGWSVWWDPEISPGKEFDDEIDGELQAAASVLVVWTPTSVASRWVRGEARDGAERGILVPVRFEQARLPIDVRAIHTIDLDDWHGNATSPALQDCLKALEVMITSSKAAHASATAVNNAPAAAAAAKDPRRSSICVLPFTNMSGDPEQEYFSDGITEDIITDLNKVSALRIISRNAAFRYKGKDVDIPQAAREMNVSHVLEGSVRRAGNRVRITAQLVYAESNDQVWAERYDRDASDIFALQDEISHAIVKALQLRLLPEEKKAIERRGTDSAEAHDLYLMARQMYVSGQENDEHAAQAIIRMCTRATDIDPRYAQAWALMAIGYRSLRALGTGSDSGMTAAERALAIDPGLAEAHAVKAYILLQNGDPDAAAAEAEVALKLDPESYEANRTAARVNYQLHRFEDAIRLYEKASALMETDLNSAMTLISCYNALGNIKGMRHAAETSQKRAETILARDQNNVGALAYSAYALAALDEHERAKARMNRALMIDPDNFNMRYNFACSLTVLLRDKSAALEMLDPLFRTITDGFLPYAKADPDFASLHDDPRWQAMLAAAEARLGAAKTSQTPVTKKS